MLGAVLVPLALIAILKFVVRGGSGPFGVSTKRASLRTRSLSGSNAALMLTVFGLGELILSIAGDLSRWHALVKTDGSLLGALGAVLIIALVAVPKAEPILALAGVVAGTAGVFIEHGEATGIGFVVMIALMLVFLGFVRGLLPGGR